MKFQEFQEKLIAALEAHPIGLKHVEAFGATVRGTLVYQGETKHFSFKGAADEPDKVADEIIRQLTGSR
jgi:hypothetical protein